jgi:hypothetical protein
MSEFKFTCPNCQQNIQATPEYSGLKINCPSCKSPLVVPPAPDPQGGTAPRLSVAVAPEQAHAARTQGLVAAPPVRRKKPLAAKIAAQVAGWTAAAGVVVALIIYHDPLWKKIKKFNTVGPTPEEQAATNQPPPPPPPALTAEEILQKVGDTYKALTDYAAKGQTVAEIDMSAIMAGRRMNTKTASSMQLGRTNFYRLEWETTIPGQNQPIKGVAWCSGKGHYSGYGPYPPNKVKTRELAMQPAAASFVLSAGIAELFFSTSNSLAEDVQNFSKTNGPGLESKINGQDCYVLTGEASHQDFVVWVSKKTFLISQIQLVLGGPPLTEADVKSLPPGQRSQALKASLTASKMKGTVTETYDSIQVNQNLTPMAFETAYTPPPSAAGETPARRRPGSMAGKLTEPRRGRGP